jgi:hypothetical protein
MGDSKLCALPHPFGVRVTMSVESRGWALVASEGQPGVGEKPPDYGHPRRSDERKRSAQERADG